MVEKKIKALKDFELRTFFGPHYMIDGEVRKIRFKNQQTFEGLLKFGNFVEAKANEEEVKVIPVIQPPVEENTIVEDKQGLPFVEAIQDNSNLDEAGEPMSEETPEDLRRDEPLQVEEEIERAATEGKNLCTGFGAVPEDEEVPVEEIDYRDTTVARPTDSPDALNEPEELTPEEETEGLVEVEEIPIEEQDESKPELEPVDEIPIEEARADETHPQV